MVPDMWGSSSPSSLRTKAGEGPSQEEPESLDSMLKLPFELKQTFVSSVVLFYPVVLCMILHSRLTVRFLVGNWAFWTAVAVPLWVLFCHVAIVRKVIPIRLAPIYTIIIPAACFAFACQIQAWQFNGQEAALLAKDCDSFLVKARLERSWWQAHEFFHNCTRTLSHITGASLEETKRMADFKGCEGYREAPLQLREDWSFLEHLEQTHYCGGWCSVQLPIWSPVSVPLDSCSQASARALVGNASLLSLQATTYSGLLLLCTCVTLVLYPSWFSEI